MLENGVWQRMPPPDPPPSQPAYKFKLVVPEQSKPRDIPPPVVQPEPQLIVHTPEPKSPSRILRLGHEPGGRVYEHWLRFANLAADGVYIEITADCFSACTLLMTHLPSERLCFTPSARLGFHKARNSMTNEPAWDTTTTMVQSYPPNIREWIAQRGGIWGMPLNGYWILTAPELWKMGYRRCDS
jgi:hypothetical protein